MTDLSLFLLIAAAVAALADWWAVAGGRTEVEYAAKPAALALLTGAAIALDVGGAMRWWFVAALVCSLAGDVFLMLPRDLFVAGLASFLVGHVAYVVGFVVGGLDASGAAVGLAVVAVVAIPLARRILRAVSDADRALIGPVAAYIVVISAMVVAAFGAVNVLAIGGALLFYASDACIAWNRFVQPFPAARVTIMVTYHLGQAGLVASLVAG